MFTITHNYSDLPDWAFGFQSLDLRDDTVLMGAMVMSDNEGEEMALMYLKNKVTDFDSLSTYLHEVGHYLTSCCYHWLRYYRDFDHKDTFYNELMAEINVYNCIKKSYWHKQWDKTKRNAIYHGGLKFIQRGEYVPDNWQEIASAKLGWFFRFYLQEVEEVVGVDLYNIDLSYHY